MKVLMVGASVKLAGMVLSETEEAWHIQAGVGSGVRG
jgi:hypothetical protein